MKGSESILREINLSIIRKEVHTFCMSFPSVSLTAQEKGA